MRIGARREAECVSCVPFVLLPLIYEPLFTNQGAIGHDMPRCVPERIQLHNSDFARDGLHHAQQVGAHHAFILGIDNGRVYFVNQAVSLRSNCYSSWMRQVFCWLVFEIDEMRGNKDKDENQRDHHVVMEAAPLVSPEKITFNRSPGA